LLRLVDYDYYMLVLDKQNEQENMKYSSSHRFVGYEKTVVEHNLEFLLIRRELDQALLDYPFDCKKRKLYEQDKFIEFYLSTGLGSGILSNGRFRKNDYKTITNMKSKLKRNHTIGLS
jgi:hypothetical protein